MPYKPIDYSKCSIYKLEHVNNDKLIYIGSTTNFKQRKSAHKTCCNNEKGRKYNLKLYRMIRENGGFEMFKMIELEKYPCKDRQEIERREYEMIREVKATMNTHFFYSDEEKPLKQKRYEEYKMFKNIYDECMFELDFFMN
jgi:predicted GIY-YIG superfamily endonuclease